LTHLITATYQLSPCPRHLYDVETSKL